ncbi:MAG: hypothetical protein RBU37_11515 [Myxococcota bacterium]|nr:hypothetical protein [Myxococcota bacterium]
MRWCVMVSFVSLASVLSLPAYAVLEECTWYPSFQDLVAHPLDAPIPIPVRSEHSLCNTGHTEIVVWTGQESAPVVAQGSFVRYPDGSGFTEGFWVPSEPLLASTSYQVDVSFVYDISSFSGSFRVTTGEQALSLPAQLELDTATLQEKELEHSECCTDGCSGENCMQCWIESYEYRFELAMQWSNSLAGAGPQGYYFSLQLGTQQVSPILEQTLLEALQTEPSAPVCATLSMHRIDGLQLGQLERCFEDTEIVRVEHRSPPPNTTECVFPWPEDSVEWELDEFEAEGPDLEPKSKTSDGACSLGRSAPSGAWLALLSLLLVWRWRRARG